jgi:virulence-associated protein VagC
MMKTILEAKIFKNGGSNAIRIPASIELPGSSVFLEVNELSGKVIMHLTQPDPLRKFFDLVETGGYLDVPFERIPGSYAPRESMVSE